MNVDHQSFFPKLLMCIFMPLKTQSVGAYRFAHVHPYVCTKCGSIQICTRPSVCMHENSSSVCNFSYTYKGIMIDILQMVDLNVLLCKMQNNLSLVSFYWIMAPGWFLLYIHIMETLQCAQILALDCLTLTPFVTNSQLQGHWSLGDKSGL